MINKSFPVGNVDKDSFKVLVIDDESAVLEAVTDILALEDIQVITALNGMVGVGYYREHTTDIDLIILDLTMPSMSGVETYDKLREINPQARVLLSSGFDKEDVDKYHDLPGLSGYLQKPFTMSALIDTVKCHLS